VRDHVSLPELNFQVIATIEAITAPTTSVLAFQLLG
jgi:hypothetical protein